MNNKNNACFWALSLLIGSLISIVPVSGFAESVLYAIDNENPSLSVVDPVTGVEQSTIGLYVPGDAINHSTGLAVNPVTNKVYAAMKLASVAGSGRSLVEIDLATGEATNIGNMNQPIANIAFDSNGTLYAVSGDCIYGCGGGATPETLFTVNLSNASLTFFKTLGNGDDGEAIGFNPVDGMMYHMSGKGSGLIFEKINLTSGVITPIPLSGGSVTNPNLEAIGFTFDAAQNLFVGSLIECGCEGGLWSYISLTPTGVLTHVNTLPHWWKGYAFHEEGAAGDVFLDMAALPDVDSSGAVDVAVLVADLPGQGQAKPVLAATDMAKALAPTIQVFVKDGATGDAISQMTVLNDDWHAIDLVATPGGGVNALIGILAQRFNGLISVAVHRADDGSLVREIEFFNQNWVPSALAYVPNADGPGGSAFAVLAKNSTDNRVAVQLRRRSDGSLINTIVFFRNVWEPIDVEVLDDISDNDRPEIIVLGQSDLGQIVAMIRDASSQELINRIRYFGNTATPKAITVINHIGGGPDPELPLLGVRANGRNNVQNRDAMTDEQITDHYFFSSQWIAIDVGGLDDVNGNSSADEAVLAQHNTKGTIRVDVRDAATGQLIREIKFLGSSWDARAFAVFEDISGNGVQELGVAARQDDGSIRVQLRDAYTGVTVKTIDIP